MEQQRGFGPCRNEDGTVTKSFENWTAAPGYEGVYEVSDQGNVPRIWKGRPTKPI